MPKHRHHRVRPDLLEAGGIPAGLVHGVRVSSRQGAWVNGLGTAQRSTAPHDMRLHVMDFGGGTTEIQKEIIAHISFPVRQDVAVHVQSLETPMRVPLS